MTNLIGSKNRVKDIEEIHGNIIGLLFEYNEAADKIMYQIEG